LALEVGNKVLLEYLFGELPEPELSRVSELCFIDDSFSQQLSALENVLIDRYVQHTLTESERRDFEEKYLTTPGRRRKVAEAEKIIDLILNHDTLPLNPSWWKSSLAFLNNRNMVLQVSLACALVLMVLGCLWLLRDKAQLSREVEQTQASLREKEAELQRQAEAHRKASEQLQEALRAEQSLREKEAQQLREYEEMARQTEATRRGDTARSAAPQYSVATYIFPLVSIMGTQSQRQLVIRRGQQRARLILYLENKSYDQYRISIQRASGEEVWSGVVPKGQITAAGERLSVELPASVFTKKDYVLVVDAVKPDGTKANLDIRSFSVVNENVRPE
jgi:hypothetical protein